MFSLYTLNKHEIKLMCSHTHVCWMITLWICRRELKRFFQDADDDYLDALLVELFRGDEEVFWEISRIMHFIIERAVTIAKNWTNTQGQKVCLCKRWIYGKSKIHSLLWGQNRYGNSGRLQTTYIIGGFDSILLHCACRPLCTLAKPKQFDRSTEQTSITIECLKHLNGAWYRFSLK